MVNHDLSLLVNGILVVLNILAQLRRRPTSVKFRIIFYRLHQLVVTINRRVMLQHINDETFINRLLHRVRMKRHVLDHSARLLHWQPEYFQRPVLGRRRECEVTRVRQHPLALHNPIDLVFKSFDFIIFTSSLSQCHRHRCRRSTALTRMRLVDDDAELPTSMIIANLVQHEREFLNRSNHDLLAFTQKPTQITRSIRVSHNRPYLRKLPNRLIDLTVQHATIRNHNHRIQNRLAVHLDPDQLMRQPGD